MHPVSRLLLYYIGTKKTIVSFFTPRQLFQLPLLLVFAEISNPSIIPNPPIIRYSRVEHFWWLLLAPLLLMFYKYSNTILQRVMRGDYYYFAILGKNTHDNI